MNLVLKSSETCETQEYIVQECVWRLKESRTMKSTGFRSVFFSVPMRQESSLRNIHGSVVDLPCGPYLCWKSKKEEEGGSLDETCQRSVFTVCLPCISTLLGTSEWMRGSRNNADLILALVELSDAIQEAYSSHEIAKGFKQLVLSSLCVWALVKILIAC